MTAMRNALTDEEIEEQADKGEPEKGRWSQLEQLVAIVGDRLARLEYAYTCAHVEKRQRPQAPEPLRRPGAKPPKPKPKLSDASAEVLFQLINGGAA